jgi:hypothetical protein
MRATRDLLRRRCPLVRPRAELLAPSHNTTSQYHLPELSKKLADKATRDGVEEHCPFLGQNQPGQASCAKLEHKPGQAKALTGRAHKLARAVYSRLTRKQAFALQRVVAA